MPTAKRVVAVALVLCAIAAASFDYTVQRGDTLREIADANGVTIRVLVEANGISNPDLIRVGQVLVIPGLDGGDSAGDPAPPPSSATYLVQRGDSLSKIAARLGVTIAALAEANDISNPDLIRVGAVLTVPGGEPATSSGGGDGGAGGPDVAGTSTYVVQRGDTLGRIAARFGISVSALAEANGISNPNLIFPGAQLLVSGSGGGGSTPAPPPRLSDEVWIAPGAGEPAAEAYTVVGGDTIAKIAGRYGVGISDIVEANQLSNPNLLRVGQVLTIPLGDGWVCPVPDAPFGDTWGAPRPGGRLHEGTDLFAPTGTPILAPVPGIVTIQTGQIAGIQFTLQGDDGNWYFGTHLSEATVTGRVVAGQEIGKVGNTGNAITTPPHLHFEIHRGQKGNELNPYHTLVKACR